MHIINVLLVKANWCGHCKNFQPVFKKAIDLVKDKSNTKYEIRFSIYEDEKKGIDNSHLSKEEISKQDYSLLEDMFKLANGYPSIICSLNKENIESIKRVDIKSDKHMDSLKEDELDKLVTDAAKSFLEIIDNYYKTHSSDRKELHTQVGGNNLYKHKYLKYKRKYLELQNQY